MNLKEIWERMRLDRLKNPAKAVEDCKKKIKYIIDTPHQFFSEQYKRERLAKIINVEIKYRILKIMKDHCQ